MINSELKQKLLDFRSERDWEQFHTLRTLSASLVLEAAELLELTQWTPDSELHAVEVSKREQIEEEVADLAILLTYLIHDLGLDLDQIVAAKMLANGQKYPVEKSRGSSAKYSSLDVQ